MNPATPDDNQSVVRPRSLTDDEVGFFNTFGFLVMRQHFTTDEMETIDAEFTHGMNLTYRDSQFDGSVESSERLQGVDLSKSTTPFMYSLPEGPHFHGIAQQLFGKDVIGHETSVYLFVGETRWHADRSGPDVKVHMFGCKFCFYPEPLDGESGALRVIPGSHLPPFFEELRKTPGIGDSENIRNFPGFVCRTNPGDVVLFNLNCWHASCGGRPGRPLFDVVYYAYPTTPQHEKETRFTYARNRQMSIENALASNEEPATPTPEEYLNRGDSPLKTRWLVDLPREFGYFDFDVEAYIKELQSRQ